MARKKSQSIQRRGRGTPDRFYNPEKPPSTSTESFRSISPLIDGTTRMMIDEPKDLNLPSSNENPDLQRHRTQLAGNEFYSRRDSEL
ncbi:hypothetical protein TNCV_3742431 [Trichonephila clavipes]|nr:hypothetical protein TNCV_3742431 [Trichonephila clavipes]